MRLKKRIFYGFTAFCVVVLGVVRHTVIAPPPTPPQGGRGVRCTELLDAHAAEPTVPQTAEQTTPLPPRGGAGGEAFRGEAFHPIYSVPSYAQAFPDLQEVQIVAAQKHGVRPAQDREDAENRKQELVWVGSSPYYSIDPAMRSSIPYLVPRAADLMQTIGRNFFDSLYVKGIPLHRVILTSAMRTEHDVRRLRRGNVNASEQSCHRFGTTVDISYIRFNPVCPPGEDRRTVRDDTLKRVLAEVLRDLRESGRCYVKYERKQSCFHITTR